MTTRASTANRPVYSASAAALALGKAIGEIKHQDGLTWADIGAVLGKSEDQAAKYADGTAVMDFITYGRGKQYWNGRFTGYFERLCVDSRPGTVSDRHCQTSLLEAALAFSVALEDGEFSPQEVLANRHTLESAKDAIEAMLAKLTVAAA